MVDKRRTRLTKRDRKRLVGFYQNAMQRIAETLTSSALLPKQRPRFTAILQETNAALDELDAKAAAWSRSEMRKLYRGNLRWFDKKLVAKGVPRRRVVEAAAYSQVHERVIQDLILNPETGLGPRLKRVSDQMRISVRQYVQQHRTLLTQVRTMNEEIAQGILTGQTARETRDAILGAIQGKKPRSLLGLPRAGVTAPYQTFLDAPFIAIPTKAALSGFRHVHVFDYVNLVAVTKESEVRNKARNQRARERGTELVQITPNPPLTPCVCSLYAGRVFALTDEAAAATGYPLLARTPNGGPPFHPFCTHSTIPYVEEFATKKERELVGKSGEPTLRTVRGVPVGVLDKPFGKAQKFFAKRGGLGLAKKQNPILSTQKPSAFADDRVKDLFGDD